ncbi:histidine phosphatase family protein [Fontimonas sp. SYSU GA230001]|uniref:SixA phosphatase family protein n=1 Tax=Fontimonas sp. SYSU GA230001 TaxID=3142450 RepID=UPI0032B3ACBB
MRLLTLVRHAKSSWDFPALDDFDRPLNERGQRDAPRMAELVKRAVGVPDRLVSSPATRAITTARIFAEAFGIAAGDIQERARIYDASPETLLDLVRLLDDRDRHVMLFGHNPGLTELAHRLARCSFDDLPTCAVVQIGFGAASWGDVDERAGTQRFYACPRQFRQKT